MAREFEIDLRKLAAMQLPFEAVLKALSVRHRANLLLTCSDFENALPETERCAAARRFIYQFAKRQGVDLSGRHFGKAGGTASVALRRLALHVLIRDHSQLMVGNRWRLQTERFGTFRKDIARSIILDTLRSGVYAGFCFDSWMDIPSLLHYAAAKDKQILEAIIQGANFDKAARRLDHRAMSALACACLEAPENALLLLKARTWPENEPEERMPSFKQAYTPLYIACERGHTWDETTRASVLQLLLSQQPRTISRRCITGLAPIHVASFPSAVVALCRSNADPNLVSAQGGGAGYTEHAHLPYCLRASGRQSPLIFAANKPPVLEALLKAGAVLPPHDRRSPFLPADKSEEKLLLAAVQQVDRIRAGERLSSVDDSESESGVEDCDKDYGQELLAAPPHIRVTSSDDGGFGKGMEGLRRRE
eukprot:CAMPEP_0177710668 /NCGR_PEP_ID=MMETSP0484_2-20121128/11457_1 /TAXON_ID=354590 /ORGANISM="Rhodomonas lens, Strain RHODO" /LENGTH=421 /DNA_ID=CAMNT_0019222363 /DNA_START=107 /DNA_END=1369 /DNA_ORIENTATION=-